MRHPSLWAKAIAIAREASNQLTENARRAKAGETITDADRDRVTALAWKCIGTLNAIEELDEVHATPPPEKARPRKNAPTGRKPPKKADTIEVYWHDGAWRVRAHAIDDEGREHDLGGGKLEVSDAEALRYEARILKEPK